MPSLIFSETIILILAKIKGWKLLQAQCIPIKRAPAPIVILGGTLTLKESSNRAIMRDDLGNSIRSERMFKVSFFEVFSLLPAEEHLWDDSTM